MTQGLIGKKLGMTQLFVDDGIAEAATAIEAGPCAVTQIKSKDKEGYNAVQLGFGSAKRLNKPERGHLKKSGLYKHLREFRVDDTSQIQIGQKFDAGLFQPGDLVHITAISKGKGFAGVVKRWGFAGGPKTHGQSDRHRAPGSIGAGTDPGRVLKGHKMAGHMGNRRVTARNLKVLRVIPEQNLLLIGGAVPGARNGLLIIRKAAKGDGKGR
jgi:large subunit ribosomal protein L3